jgi:hypothetical protein
MWNIELSPACSKALSWQPIPHPPSSVSVPSKYGGLGKGYIERHPVIPISQLAPSQDIRVRARAAAPFSQVSTKRGHPPEVSTRGFNSWLLGMSLEAGPMRTARDCIRRDTATIDLIVANGGEIVQPVGGAPVITARFRDPGGNVIGLCQQGG